MLKIGDLATYIIRTGSRADRNVFNAFGSFLQFFENDLKMRAPVDSGAFKESWSATQVSNSEKGLSATISNDKIYASAIEFGSSPGGSPWPNPGPKTVMSNGRIYSSQAVGGTMNKTLNNANIKEFAETLANSILRAFK